jgi:hypothetical protein
MDNARRALRPLERVIMLLGGLVLLGSLLNIGSAVSGHESFLEFGSPAVCLDVSPWSSDTFPDSGRVRVSGLADGARASVRTVDICTADPTTRERILSSIDEGAVPLFADGLLFLLWWLLRQARREGVFVRAFARRVTGLGVYVLLGAGGIVVVRSWAEYQLQKSLIPGGSHQATWMFSFTPLLVGLGLITLGRLMAATVPMREEIDATV